MGKRKQKNKIEHNQTKAKRRRKSGQKKCDAERCWVEFCTESKKKKSNNYGSMFAVITRVELTDDHNHNGNSINFSGSNLPCLKDGYDDAKSAPTTNLTMNDSKSVMTNERNCNQHENSLVVFDKSNNEKLSNTMLFKNEATAVNVAEDAGSKDGKPHNSSELVEQSINKAAGVEYSANAPEKQTILNIQKNTVHMDTAETEKAHEKDDFINKDEDNAKNIIAPSAESNTGEKPKDQGLALKTSPENENKDYSQSFIRVIRAPSAKWKPRCSNKAQKEARKKFTHLANGNNGDGVVNPHRKDEVADKYWAQRKRLFSKFDQGIKLDKESWFSVTPEVIANHIAIRAGLSVVVNESQKQKGIILLDAFCGCGGNAIAFALKSEIEIVVCVDFDRNKLRMAAHNASIYKVNKKKIVFIEGDSIHIMGLYSKGKRVHDITSTTSNNAMVKVEHCEGYIIGSLSHLPSTLDAIFLSPPWGGVNYLNEGGKGYEISNCIKVSREHHSKSFACNADTVDGDELLLIAARAAKQRNVMYFLPRNINGVSLGRAALKAGYTKRYELEQNVLNGKLKTITAYFHEDLKKPK